MSESAIEMKRGGIKIGYRRFLSDSAAGFIVILLFLYAFRSDIEPRCDTTQAFLYFLLFLISTPLGLAINAVSYRFLERFAHCIEKCYVKRKIRKEWFCLKTGAEHEFLFRNCKNFFNLSETNWIEVSRHILKIMAIYHPDRYEAHDHEVGVQVFFRNLAFITLCLSGVAIWHCVWFSFSNSLFYKSGSFLVPWGNIGIGIISVIAFILSITLFLIICSYLSYYYHLAMICEAYNLCFGKIAQSENIDAKITCLVKISEREARRKRILEGKQGDTGCSS